MLSDIDLARSCIQGSPKAHKILYMRFAPVMKVVIARYIKDADLASDLLQESFIRIFDSLKKYRAEGSLEGWMKRVVVTTVMNHFRSNKRLSLIISEENYEIPDPGDDNDNDESLIDKIMEMGFTIDFLLQLLHNLPPHYSSIFNLYYIDGLSHREISEILQISEHQSRKWVFRAKHQMKDQLMDYINKKTIPLTNGRQG